MNGIDYLANYGTGIGLLIATVSIIIFVHLTILQAVEWAKIQDFLKKYRGYILTFIVITLLSQIPGALRLFLIWTGTDVASLQNLSNLATITTRLGYLAQGIAFEIIYFYRKKKGE